MAAMKLRNLSKQLREIRVHLCQTSSSSVGVRNFVEQHYVGLKQTNPDLPILIRECSGVQPKLIARFDMGVEKSVLLDEQSAEQVLKSLENLVKNG